MQTLTSSTTQLEALAFERLAQENFTDREVDFNQKQGLFTGYFQITSTVSIDFTDSKFCLADEGEKIADISIELERAYENYLISNYQESSNDDDYEYADMKIKLQKEN